MEFFEVLQTYVVPLVIAAYAALKAFLKSREGIKKKLAPYEGKSKWIKTPAGDIEFIYHNEKWITAGDYVKQLKESKEV